jgi:hypothetical protein
MNHLSGSRFAGHFIMLLACADLVLCGFKKPAAYYRIWIIMRKLTNRTTDIQKDEKRVSRFAPIVAGAIAMGFTLGAPLKSDAEQPRRAQQCSASVERGRISSYTSTTGSARLFRTPLLEENRYLQISMPNAYVDQVVQAASARPEAERQGFISGMIQKNVSIVVTTIGSRTRLTYECAPVEPATAAAPAQPPAQQPAPPAPAPSTTEPPQPAPSQDGGTEPPAQRRRVIQPGAAPSSKAAPAPKREGATAQAPIPPARKGGKGTEREPYVIEVPVPSKTAAGTNLYSETFSYLYTGERASQKVYIALRFVSAKGATFTSKDSLAGQIAPLASSCMREALGARGGDAPSSGSLLSSIRAIIERAKANTDVKAYVLSA